MKALVLGAGIVGITTAYELNRDGHEVTVLERDPTPPPPPDAAWDEWERRGVNQFRMLHFLQPRYRELMAANVPEVLTALLDGREGDVAERRYEGVVVTHQRHVVGRPLVPLGLFGLAAGLHQIEEVGVRQHRALGLARGAGGVEHVERVLGIELDRGADVARARAGPHERPRVLVPGRGQTP